VYNRNNFDLFTRKKSSTCLQDNDKRVLHEAEYVYYEYTCLPVKRLRDMNNSKISDNSSISASANNNNAVELSPTH